MNVSDLNDNQLIYKILRKPIPKDFSNLRWISKLKFVPIIYLKRKILMSRANTPLNILEDELCVYTPGLHMEYLRCTDMERMESYIDSLKTPVIEVKLTGEAPVIGVRVGKHMARLLNDKGVSLKMIDIYGEEILMSKVESTFIYNKQYQNKGSE